MWRRRLPSLRRVWTLDDSAVRRGRRPAGDRARGRGPSRPTTSWSCSPPGAAARRRAWSTPTAAPCGRWPRASTLAASAPATGSTSRCRSSGPAGSRAVCCPSSSPAPRCSPRRSRNPCGPSSSSSGSGSRSSGAGRTRRLRLAAHPRFASTDLSSLGGGQPARRAPRRPAPAPGARANVFGMTETFGPYCRRPARPRPAGRRTWQLRSTVRRVRGPHRPSRRTRSARSASAAPT